jgi:hypothetical protein
MQGPLHFLNLIGGGLLNEVKMKKIYNIILRALEVLSMCAGWIGCLTEVRWW